MKRIALAASAGLALLVGSVVGSVPPAGATPPTSVTVGGSFQSELGCAGDWQPDCATTRLVRGPASSIWRASFVLPPGGYDYKIALNNSWSENYGAGGIPDGANIGLSLPATSTVRFYFDEQSHWIADSANDVIATVAGDFQSELGCPGDWDPSCLASLLEVPPLAESPQGCSSKFLTLVGG